MRVSAGAPSFDAARLPGGGSLIGLCAAASAVLLALSGCSGDKPTTTPTGGKSSQGGADLSKEKAISSEPMAHQNGPAHVDLIALTGTARNTVTARLRIVNDGQETITLDSALTDTGNGVTPATATNGIALVDGVGNKVYYPLATSGGGCMCSDLSGAEIGPGKSRDVYAVLPAPQARKVTIFVPMTAPFTDVTIGSGQAPPAPDQSHDPAKETPGAPNVRALVNASESATEGTDDDGSNRTVRLSADVLFAFNKANLSPRANAILQQVAKQIDASKGTTVKVDGYTDNSGSDAVNQPLSERRAQSVVSALKGMVTRQGITYQAAGHGSQNPVAKNDDESGRKRNRRVTVAFARPPEPQTQPPAAGPQSAPAWTPKGKLPVIASTRARFGATASAVEQEADNFRIDVNSLHRDSAGLVTLVWTVTNVGSADGALSGGQFGKYLSLEYSVPFSTSGVSLVDKAGQTRYWPLRDGSGVCMCNTMSEATDGALTLSPNQSATFADVYKPPPGVGTVDIAYGWLGSTIPPAAQVPVK